MRCDKCGEPILNTAHNCQPPEKTTLGDFDTPLLDELEKGSWPSFVKEENELTALKAEGDNLRLMVDKLDAELTELKDDAVKVEAERDIMECDIAGARVSLDKFFDEPPAEDITNIACDVREMYCKLGDRFERVEAEMDRYKEKHNNTSDLYTVAIDRIIALESDRDNLLETVKLAYRKHCMGDDEIGWEELDTALLDTLCESMGDEVFCDWTTNTRKELDK